MELGPPKEAEGVEEFGTCCSEPVSALDSVYGGGGAMVPSLGDGLCTGIFDAEPSDFVSAGISAGIRMSD